MQLFSYSLFKTYVPGAQKNHLDETVLLSTHNICFDLEMRKLLQFYTKNVWILFYALLSGGL